MEACVNIDLYLLNMGFLGSKEGSIRMRLGRFWHFSQSVSVPEALNSFQLNSGVVC